MSRSMVAAPRTAASRAAIAMAWILAASSPAGAETAADSAAVTPSPGAPRASMSAAASWRSSVQISAPSINSASPDLVDRGGFPALAGIACDERLEQGHDDRAITLNVTPLALARAVRRDDARTADDRIAARVTIGGPLQKTERSNVSRADRATNHITSELKMILFGDGSASRGYGHATVLALALVADNLATGYGLDRYGATLIAEREGLCVWTANAGYRVVERFHASSRIEETKLATGVQWRFAMAGHPLQLALSGGCLLRARSIANWQDGARVDVPLMSGLRLSAAVRHSQRPELPGQDRLREVVSLAYGLGDAPH